MAYKLHKEKYVLYVINGKEEKKKNENLEILLKDFKVVDIAEDKKFEYMKKETTFYHNIEKNVTISVHRVSDRNKDYWNPRLSRVELSVSGEELEVNKIIDYLNAGIKF